MSADDFSPEEDQKSLKWFAGVTLGLILAILLILAEYWSFEPIEFDVIQETLTRLNLESKEELSDGQVYANTLAHIAEVLLYKPGGYMTNDVGPPGVILDNIPSFEFGALVMLRDATSALRNHLARAQSQSAEDPDLAIAEPYFYYERNSWALPSTEAEYTKGIHALHRYMKRLHHADQPTPGHFYSRADNLWQYIEIVIKRLGGLSTRLNASSDRYQEFGITDETKPAPITKTPWIEIDDIFWESRGAAWALLHILKAIKWDFRAILLDKRAMDTVDIMIHEMENALEPVLSPMILNGDGFGMFANYSLIMANYIARANAAALDLRDVMNRG